MSICRETYIANQYDIYKRSAIESKAKIPCSEIRERTKITDILEYTLNPPDDTEVCMHV